MKNIEILELTTEEIVAALSSHRLSLTKLKFAHFVSAIENSSRITMTRKIIARLNTELTKRKLKEGSAPVSFDSVV